MKQNQRQNRINGRRYALPRFDHPIDDLKGRIDAPRYESIHRKRQIEKTSNTPTQVCVSELFLRADTGPTPQAIRAVGVWSVSYQLYLYIRGALIRS